MVRASVRIDQNADDNCKRMTTTATVTVMMMMMMMMMVMVMMMMMLLMRTIMRVIKMTYIMLINKANCIVVTA